MAYFKTNAIKVPNKFQSVRGLYLPSEELLNAQRTATLPQHILQYKQTLYLAILSRKTLKMLNKSDVSHRYQKDTCRDKGGQDARFITCFQLWVDPQLHIDFTQCSPCSRVLRTGLNPLQMDFEELRWKFNWKPLMSESMYLPRPFDNQRHLSDTEKSIKFKSVGTDQIRV
jgi:hypothetical protein